MFSVLKWDIGKKCWSRSDTAKIGPSLLSQALVVYPLPQPLKINFKEYVLGGGGGMLQVYVV